MAHANNEFIGACLDFDALMARLATLRANHFNVEDPEAARNWGEVGSVRYVNERLAEALAHYEGGK